MVQITTNGQLISIEINPNDRQINELYTFPIGDLKYSIVKDTLLFYSTANEIDKGKNLSFNYEKDLYVNGVKATRANITTLLNSIFLVSGGGGGGRVDTIQLGSGISVNSTDPANPIITATGGLSESPVLGYGRLGSTYDTTIIVRGDHSDGGNDEFFVVTSNPNGINFLPSSTYVSQIDVTLFNVSTVERITYLALTRQDSGTDIDFSLIIPGGLIDVSDFLMNSPRLIGTLTVGESLRGLYLSCTNLTIGDMWYQGLFALVENGSHFGNTCDISTTLVFRNNCEYVLTGTTYELDWGTSPPTVISDINLWVNNWNGNTGDNYHLIQNGILVPEPSQPPFLNINLLGDIPLPNEQLISKTGQLDFEDEIYFDTLSILVLSVELGQYWKTSLAQAHPDKMAIDLQLSYLYDNLGGGGGGGIPELPNDGKQYGRQSELWTEIPTSTTGLNTDLSNLSVTGELHFSKFDGDYNSLTNTPTLGTAAATDSTDYATAAQGSTADSAVQPSDLADVATSGDYSDLINTPTLGTAAATDATDYATASQGLNADTAVQPSDLATVATSGAYGDLSGKPTIPTVGTGVITLQQGGISKGTFNVNQSTNSTINFDAGGGGGYVLPTVNTGKFSYSATATAPTDQYQHLFGDIVYNEQVLGQLINDLNQYHFYYAPPFSNPSQTQYWQCRFKLSIKEDTLNANPNGVFVMRGLVDFKNFTGNNVWWGCWDGGNFNGIAFDKAWAASIDISGQGGSRGTTRVFVSSTQRGNKGNYNDIFGRNTPLEMIYEYQKLATQNGSVPEFWQEVIGNQLYNSSDRLTDSIPSLGSLNYCANIGMPTNSNTALKELQKYSGYSSPLYSLVEAKITYYIGLDIIHIDLNQMVLTKPKNQET